MRMLYTRWLALVLMAGSVAGAVEVGDEWDKVSVELGKPLGRVEAGARTLYRWPQLEVTVEAGRVTKVQRLDAPPDATAAERRAQAMEAERARIVAVRKEQARLQAEASAKEEAARVEREAATQSTQGTKKAALAVESAEQKRQLAEVASQRAKELEASAIALEKEMSILRLDMSRARAEGDILKSRRIAATIEAKAKEQQALRDDAK